MQILTISSRYGRARLSQGPSFQLFPYAKATLQISSYQSNASAEAVILKGKSTWKFVSLSSSAPSPSPITLGMPISLQRSLLSEMPFCLSLQGLSKSNTAERAALGEPNFHMGCQIRIQLPFPACWPYVLTPLLYAIANILEANQSSNLNMHIVPYFPKEKAHILLKTIVLMVKWLPLNKSTRKIPVHTRKWRKICNKLIYPNPIKEFYWDSVSSHTLLPCNHFIDALLHLHTRRQQIPINFIVRYCNACTV